MSSFLVVDMRAVLDKSKVGLNGAKRLEALWSRIQAEEDAPKRLEAMRAELRAQVLARAEPALQRLCAERGADFVLERAAVLIAPPEADVTEAVIAAVDGLGPLPP